MVFAVLIILFFTPLYNSTFYDKNDIHIAIYYSTIQDYAEEVKTVMNYSWTYENIRYTIHPTIITKQSVLNDELLSYDVLVIPGSGQPYIDALDPLWKKMVKQFIEQGGGYIGICGGANIASMGFKDDIGINNFLNQSVLEIVNVYVNNQQDEEWQYLWRANWEQGGLPINVFLPQNNNPIFQELHNTNRSIRYWGGPGMYPAHKIDHRLGDVIPLGAYSEEAMDVAPLHFWGWNLRQPYQRENITTDIKDQYAIVASTYGLGRIVLFGPHPERATFFDGYIEEFPVRPHLAPFTWFIYNWISENQSSISYNWWMLRRSVAWIVQVSLPPIED